MAIVASTAIAFVGCTKDYETNSTQQSNIVSYLESSHSPTLIAESELSSAIDINPAFYTIYGDYAYRYIATYYDEGREAMAEISNGSRVTITFEIYPTTNGSISSGELPSYTNNPEFIEEYIEAGLNLTAWSFEPLAITVGNGEVMECIDLGLVGCRVGDDVELFATRNMAYGNSVIGLIDEGSALYVKCFIENVEN